MVTVSAIIIVCILFLIAANFFKKQFHLGRFDNMRHFEGTFECYSVSKLPGKERHDVDEGGKIILPPSALDSLTRFNVGFPMHFKLTNNKEGRSSHAGVLEFIADEGKCYLPDWLMKHLQMEEGGEINLETASLPVATFARFQALTSDFLDISNPQAVLENALRSFACLTTGDVIAINYNKKVYELSVLETQPGVAVQIFECDMDVEFEAPVGYIAPIIEPANIEPPQEADGFPGVGMRLDGKQVRNSEMASPQKVEEPPTRGIPNDDFQYGSLEFDRQPENGISTDNEDAKNEAFKGHGYSTKKSE